MDDDPDRLLANVWLKRLLWIQGHLRGRTPIEPLLRHAFHLTQIAPLKWIDLVSDPVDESVFEAALENDDWDSAITFLLGDRLRVTRLTPTSGSMAVNVRDERASGSAIGETFARAVLGAWLTRLISAVRRDAPGIDRW